MGKMTALLNWIDARFPLTATWRALTVTLSARLTPRMSSLLLRMRMPGPAWI